MLSSLPVSLPAFGALTIFIVIFAWIPVRRSGGPPFPPGPRPDPLIGNIRQIGSNDLKVLFEQWGREYGGSTMPEMPQYYSRPSQVLLSTHPPSENLSSFSTLSMLPKTSSRNVVAYTQADRDWLLFPKCEIVTCPIFYSTVHAYIQDGMGVCPVPAVWWSHIPETPQNHARNDGYPFLKRIFPIAEESNTRVLGRPWGDTRKLRRPY